MDVTLIGELTEGKNVGMEMQKNDKYEWIYWPITLRDVYKRQEFGGFLYQAIVFFQQFFRWISPIEQFCQVDEMRLLRCV